MLQFCSLANIFIFLEHLFCACLIILTLGDVIPLISFYKTNKKKKQNMLNSVKVKVHY
jgi:hypothetical protein